MYSVAAFTKQHIAIYAKKGIVLHFATHCYSLSLSTEFLLIWIILKIAFFYSHCIIIYSSYTISHCIKVAIHINKCTAKKRWLVCHLDRDNYPSCSRVSPSHYHTELLFCILLRLKAFGNVLGVSRVMCVVRAMWPVMSYICFHSYVALNALTYCCLVYRSNLIEKFNIQLNIHFMG